MYHLMMARVLAASFLWLIASGCQTTTKPAKAAETTPTNITQAASFQPTAGAQRIAGNDRWDVYRTLREPNGSYDTQESYNYIAAKVDIGDSGLTESERRSTWQRFLEAIGWENVDGVSFVIGETGAVPKLPLYVITKSATASEQEVRLDSWQVTPNKTMSPGETHPVRLEARASEKVTSTVVTNAVKAATTISGALGLGPAAVVLKAIPVEMTKDIDALVSTFSTSKFTAVPEFPFNQADMPKKPLYEIVLFDKPSGDANRRVIAKITLTAERRESVLTTAALPLTDRPSSYFDKLVNDVSVNGLSSDKKQTLRSLVANHQTLQRTYFSPAYQDYASFCTDARSLVSSMGFTATDITLSHYALLATATGLNSVPPKSAAFICPTPSWGADMRKLGLRPLPPEISVPTDRDIQRARFDVIAAAMAGGANPSFKEVCDGIVFIRQTEAILPQVPASKDTDKEYSDVELEGFFKSLSDLKVNGVRIGTFAFTGQNSNEGTAIMTITRTDRPTQRIKIRIRLNEDQRISRIELSQLL